MKIKETIKCSAKVIKDFFSMSSLASTIIFICYCVTSIYAIYSTHVINKLFENAPLIKSSSESLGLFKKYVIIFVIIFAIRNLMEIIINAPRAIGIYTKCKYILDDRIAMKLTRISPDYFERTEQIEKYERARNAVQMNRLQRIFFDSLDFLFSIISYVGTVVILCTYNWILAVVSLLFTIPVFITIKIRGEDMYELKYYQSNERLKTNYLWGLFINRESVKELKVFQSEKYVYNKWKKSFKRMFNQEYDFLTKDNRIALLCQFGRIAGTAVAIIITLYLIKHTNMAIAVFPACLNAFHIVHNKSQEIFTLLGGFYEKTSYANDYYGFVNCEDEKDGNRSISEFKTKLSVDNISFKYPNSSQYALKNVSFSVNKGEKVVIVGENGSGKTTLTKVLLRIFEPEEGSVFIDDNDIREYKLKDFYNIFSIVPQDYGKYYMDILTNVTIGNIKKSADEEATEKEANQIINDSGLSSLLDQYDTKQLLGKEFGGVDISGGEWNKLAIARAKYKDGYIYILDEPTSALDPLIENQILLQFLDISKNRTVFIISHRVGLCKFADKIIVMKNGEVIDTGSHKELLERCEHYKFLYTEQQKWYL